VARWAAEKGQIMRNHILRRFSQISWIAVLSLSLTLAVTGQSTSRPSMASGNVVKPKAKEADEMELALAAAGAGSVAEMKGRLFTHSITLFNEEFRAQAISALPASLHKRRITQGKLLGRVETVFRKTLQFHGRSGKLDLFLFQDDVPSARLWRGCALVLSREAGAAALVGEAALLVNPYDVSATADALHAGLVMSAAERRRRTATIADAAAARAPQRWLAEQVEALG